TWVIDGVETKETYEYGATPSHADPVKEADAQYIRYRKYTAEQAEKPRRRIEESSRYKKFY
ncbi:MAG: hypothetical protein IJ969_01630, partial [Anaerotignum sp.]|nr:hypothetical protein [Anaerotignum sp.]